MTDLDEQATQRPDFYCNEDGTEFWAKADRPLPDVLAGIERDLGMSLDPSRTTKVHGFEHRNRKGEPWFTKTAKGVEFWEIQND